MVKANINQINSSSNNNNKIINVINNKIINVINNYLPLGNITNIPKKQLKNKFKCFNLIKRIRVSKILIHINHLSKNSNKTEDLTCYL